MIYIHQDKDQNIISYGETVFEIDQSSGDSIVYSDLSFYEYSRRLVLSHNGVSSNTVQAYQSGPDVTIDVATNLKLDSVDLDINGFVETVPLVSGKGKLVLSTANPGVFVITPADRKTFCAAGMSSIAVEVAPNA